MTGQEAEEINRRHQEKMRRLRGERKKPEFVSEQGLPNGPLDYDALEQDYEPEK